MVSDGGTGGLLSSWAVSNPLALRLSVECSEVEHDRGKNFKKLTPDASVIRGLVTGMLKWYSN